MLKETRQKNTFWSLSYVLNWCGDRDICKHSYTNNNNINDGEKIYTIPIEWKKVYQIVQFLLCMYLFSFQRFVICDPQTSLHNRYGWYFYVLFVCAFSSLAAAHKSYIRKIIHTNTSGTFDWLLCCIALVVSHNFCVEMEQKLNKKKLVDIPKMNVPVPIIIMT